MISAIVLAAGTSSRLGRTKQLLEHGGKPLVQHAVDTAAAAGLDEIVVVLGHEADRVRAALRLPDTARTVVNPGYSEGQATSLAVGLTACDPASEGAVVLLADQPGVSPQALRSLVEAFRARRPRIARLAYRDGPGPALLGRTAWEEAAGLRGDVGARELMSRRPEWVLEVPVDADQPPDVDTPADLERLAGEGMSSSREQPSEGL